MAPKVSSALSGAPFQVHENVESRDHHWAVGHTHGRISEDDIVLLAIVEVSQGAMMPILKVRDGFGTDSDHQSEIS